MIPGIPTRGTNFAGYFSVRPRRRRWNWPGAAGPPALCHAPITINIGVTARITINVGVTGMPIAS
jgi:hypothetical protein